MKKILFLLVAIIAIIAAVAIWSSSVESLETLSKFNVSSVKNGHYVIKSLETKEGNVYKLPSSINNTRVFRAIDSNTRVLVQVTNWGKTLHVWTPDMEIFDFEVDLK